MEQNAKSLTPPAPKFLSWYKDYRRLSFDDKKNAVEAIAEMETLCRFHNSARDFDGELQELIMQTIIYRIDEGKSYRQRKSAWHEVYTLTFPEDEELKAYSLQRFLQAPDNFS